MTLFAILEIFFQNNMQWCWIRHKNYVFEYIQKKYKSYPTNQAWCWMEQFFLQVKVYCQNYRELKSMGFDSALVTGALLLHKQDLPAATDACLNSQS